MSWIRNTGAKSANFRFNERLMRLLEQPGEEALLPRGGEEGEEEHEQEEAGGHEGGDHQRRLQEHLQEAKTILS
jgi:hypothetical protein